MTSNATSAEEYLAGLPEDRRQAISAVREVILKNLPKGYEECIQYGMLGYVVPHSLYPAGYHCDPKQALSYASLASQKNYMSLYLMCTYAANSPQRKRLEEAYAKAGKKLDMGACCIRFKKLEDLELDVIGEIISAVSVRDYVASYEAAIPPSKRKKR